MREISEIIIHCTATKQGQKVTIEDIDRWHRARGFKCIGYHYVIYLDGSVHVGRPLEQIGAHCLGHNAQSVGICYVGGLDDSGKPKDTRTEAQKMAMAALIYHLSHVQLTGYKMRVLGHRDTSADLNGDGVISPQEWLKACPCFEAKELNFITSLYF